jgi:hypothetical protein
MSLEESLPPFGPGYSAVTRGLLKVAGDAELFLHDDGSPWATIRYGSRAETVPIEDRGLFSDWLSEGFSKGDGSAPSRNTLVAVLGTLRSRARSSGKKKTVHTRVAEYEDTISIYLGDEARNVAEITRSDWRVVPHSTIPFHCPPGTRALPWPKQGGDVSALIPYLGPLSDQDWSLILTWLFDALRPSGSHMILSLSDSDSGAASRLARVLTSLVDPRLSSPRSLPTDERDLKAAIKNSWLLCFDNLRSLKPSAQDQLCRVVDGSGYGARRQYSDFDEASFQATRPVIITSDVQLGVESRRFNARTIRIELEGPMDDEDPISPSKEELSGIFGGLLDCLVDGLKNSDR